MTMLRPSSLIARSGNRSGFTLVEILVVIAIIALLAGVALPAITGALKKAKENAAVQTAHGLGLAEFQYATDNNGTYPGKTANCAASSSSLMFQQELYPTYMNSLDSLYVSGGSATGKWAGGASVPTATSNAWDLTTRDTAFTGLSTNDPDPLPAVYTTGYTAHLNPTAGSPAYSDTPGTASPLPPFGTDGLAVGYKDLSSAFITLTSNGGTTSGGKYTLTSAAFIGAVNTYTQTKP